MGLLPFSSIVCRVTSASIEEERTAQDKNAAVITDHKARKAEETSGQVIRIYSVVCHISDLQKNVVCAGD